MIHLTRSLMRRWLGALLHIDDTPERTAAAFAIGVFFGFSPFLGFHTILGVVFAFLLNLNRVSVLLGVYSNLPWFMAPYYAITTTAGAAITGHRIPRGFRMHVEALFAQSLFHVEFWRQLATLLRPLLLPYTAGSLVGGALLAAAAYPLALAFVTSGRRLQEMIHHKQHEH